ncbi:hypothetical protein HFX_0228 [Haloferax mediterranei ATCC 33500]|uniref:Uncharacterized protein n=1 Tax=Haloferax mediterranei (strain ATCC 33500 / DSM 1411 / JCM 8866 / NBRC 14739 / NCIMB 2177 / R-4) TaxID=523841 RepID=I3R159_HALMT|nr:hypothetical protein HFX_0228 [Haloferax mediterranei ATCC 33500]
MRRESEFDDSTPDNGCIEPTCGGLNVTEEPTRQDDRCVQISETDGSEGVYDRTSVRVRI